MAQPVLPDDLIDRIVDLERRLIAVERSPQLTQTSIKEGALTVLDAAGVVRVRIGKDGSDYGVKVYDAAGANPVSLAALAFGQSYAAVFTQQGTTSTTFVDLATAGPERTVTVGQSGRVIVLGGAFAVSYDTNQSAVIGLKVDGNASYDWAVVTNNTGGDVGANIARAELIEGLTPGNHTFKLQYRQTLGGGSVEFAVRWLLVLPT